MASNDDKFPPEILPNREPIARQNLAMGQGEDGADDRRFPASEEYPTHRDTEYTDYEATTHEAPGFDDPDRLPWLDTADSYEDEGMSPLKIAGFVLGLLALFGLIAGGIYWLQNRNTGVGLGDGTGEMIAAPEGDYKVKPADAQGRDFEGEGDVAQATADGRDVTTVKPATPGQATPIADAKATAGATAGAAAATAATGTGMVQLGAFADAKSADQVWTTLGTRFAFLSGYEKKITTATVEGRQVVRLNAVTADADAAQKLCAQLKAAGGDCLIPR